MGTYSFNIYSVLSLVISDAYLLLAIYLFLKNPRSWVNRLFALVGLTMFVWGLGEGMHRAAVGLPDALFWANYVGFVGACFHSPVLLHFWLVFSGQIKNFKKRLPVFVIYLPFLFFFGVMIYNYKLLVPGMVKNYWGYSADPTPLYQLYALVLAAYVAAVIVLAFRKAAKSYGKLRNQARNIGLAILFSFILGFLTQLIGPMLHLKIPELTVIGTLFFISIIAYAVNKYGLLAISTKLVAENIINTMEDYVIAVNREMNIAFVNNSVLKDSGFKEAELKDKPISAILSADIAQLSYDQMLARFPLRNYQAEIISKNGDKVSVSVNASTLKEGSADIFGFVFVLRDMRQTEQLIGGLEQSKKELEMSKNELVKSKEELEQKNQDFEKANEKLEQINKLMVGRELKMAELKKEIEELKSKSGGA